MCKITAKKVEQFRNGLTDEQKDILAVIVNYEIRKTTNGTGKKIKELEDERDSAGKLIDTLTNTIKKMETANRNTALALHSLDQCRQREAKEILKNGELQDEIADLNEEIEALKTEIKLNIEAAGINAETLNNEIHRQAEEIDRLNADRTTAQQAAAGAQERINELIEFLHPLKRQTETSSYDSTCNSCQAEFIDTLEAILRANESGILETLFPSLEEITAAEIHNREEANNAELIEMLFPSLEEAETAEIHNGEEEPDTDATELPSETEENLIKKIINNDDNYNAVIVVLMQK